MTSSAASHLLLQLGVRADLVYLDAGHQEAEVFLDLCYYFNLLRPGGALLGDDYIASWPGVVAAADGFAARRGLGLMPMAEKFLIRKPLAAGT